jgi:hypothetical protein
MGRIYAQQAALAAAGIDWPAAAGSDSVSDSGRACLPGLDVQGD